MLLGSLTNITFNNLMLQEVETLQLSHGEQGLMYISYIVNAMVADDLAMQGARAWAAMVLTKLSWNILASAPDGQLDCLIV